jgi:heme A synthase
MGDVLKEFHQYLGYVVFVVVLVATVLAFRVGSPEVPVSGLTKLTMILLDVHVTIGIVFYVLGQWWGSTLLVAVVHPLLALAALAAGHIGIGRARRERNPRLAATGLVTALLLVTAAIGVVSMPSSM